MGWKLHGVVAFVFALSAARGIALAQSNPCQINQPISTLRSAPATQLPIVQATIIYDPNQGVCWLANANLAANATMQSGLGFTGIGPNGSMDYATAQKWVAALNASNNRSGYLVRNNWQFPTTALVDKACADVGTYGGSFGPQCTASALGNLYSMGLNLTYPASVASGLAASVPPIHNLKASYYWALQNNGGTSGTSNGGQETLSFADDIQSGTTINDTYYYRLPMLAGAIGTAPSCPSGAGVVAYTSGPASGNAETSGGNGGRGFSCKISTA